MSPNIVYTVRLASGSDIASELAAPTCQTPSGEAFLGGLKLTYQQPEISNRQIKTAAAQLSGRCFIFIVRQAVIPIIYGIELLFAQSFPRNTSTSTVDAGSGLIKICVLEVIPNTACKYFNVYSFGECKTMIVLS